MTTRRSPSTHALDARVSPAADSPAGGPTLAALVSVLLQHRRKVVAASLLVPLALLAVLLLRDRTYTTSVTFLPQGKRPPANLASLALQLGVNMPSGMDAAQSPAFYADLVRSRVILSQLADGSYPLGADSTRRVWLADALEVDDDRSAAWRRDEAMRELAREVLSVSSSPRTGVVQFAVVTTSAHLSYALSQEVLRAVSRFNQEIRQSQASAEREFTERRLQQARSELAAAESALEDFDRVNRVAVSPTLALRRQRLEREVSLRTEVYTTLAQSYEQARIEEVRDTPVLTLIDAPEVAVRPNPRGVVFGAAGGLVLGLLLGAAWALLSDQRWRTGQVQRGELRLLWSETARDLSKPWRLLSRSGGGSAAAASGH